MTDYTIIYSKLSSTYYDSKMTQNREEDEAEVCRARTLGLKVEGVAGRLPTFYKYVHKIDAV